MTTSFPGQDPGQDPGHEPRRPEPTEDSDPESTERFDDSEQFEATDQFGHPGQHQDPGQYHDPGRFDDLHQDDLDRFDEPEPAGRPEPPAPPSYDSGRGRLITTILAAVVVLVGAAASVWWFSGRNTSGHQVSAPPSRTTQRRPPRSAPTTPDNSAYGVGTCLDEPLDPATSGLELQPVSCAGDEAVLMVNQVVTQYSDCEAGADYVDHGYILPDIAANVTYCVSLVVPTNQCFEFSTNNSQPIQRAVCGSAPNVVQVESIEPATSAGAACSDKTAPDIWFYQSPTSGQFACVSSQPPSTQTGDTPTGPQTTEPVPPQS
ncbi:MAG TPA: hypothetical protein VHX38_19685 [Pseudonocardiaceae bacterium]|jgi:hypothetical protein|nr:hypothetical protein [Pseudonocardiaceae bacterium]